ncbi:hypothetical protein OS493_004264 [Desmophyllum pertusum]|uniref:Uncharacterized protein n=1 Tax=Desmophyllum pertusum TaxID=174260 RepID=A0A9W9ZT73_9CNID|nr:hypothetical protein OS493_004264 [Desmophyllum pertusum]
MATATCSSRSRKRKQHHTPLCTSLKKCTVNHHELVNLLCWDSNSSFGDLPIAMKQCIEMSKGFGWDQNSNVPDPSKELTSPLLVLACAFGKAGIVEGLLRYGFDASVVNEHCETALHASARYMYSKIDMWGRKLKSLNT